jgi:hypothetical protein
MSTIIDGVRADRTAQTDDQRAELIRYPRLDGDASVPNPTAKRKQTMMKQNTSNRPSREAAPKPVMSAGT